ncbi:MAG: hypothetical protein LBH98_00230, partial [Chitinispirillales bacterium]|nr:hypothetical protein [Chitinispirillales bacterium]
MFDKLKLSAKITALTIFLLIVMFILGSTAVVNMVISNIMADVILKEFVPITATAARLSGGISDSILMHARLYAATNDVIHYENARKGFTYLDSNLTKAADFAKNSPHLVRSPKVIGDVVDAFKEYSVLFEQQKDISVKLFQENKNTNDLEIEIMRDANKLKELLPKNSDAREFALELELGVSQSLVSVNKAMQSLDTSGFSAARKVLADGLKSFDFFERISLNSEQRNALSKYSSDYKRYAQSVERLEKLIFQLKYDISPKSNDVSDKLGQASTNAVNIAIWAITKVTTDSKNGLRLGSILVIVGFIAAIILGTFFSTLITKSTNRQMKNIIDGLSESSSQVTMASGEISNTSQSMAGGATEQAAHLEEISSSLNEITSMTKQTADNAKNADVLVKDSVQKAKAGKEAMGRLHEAVIEIQNSGNETAKILKDID